MGQRLNLEIRYGNISLANSYYHWSAYTSPAFHLTERAIEEYFNYPKNNILKLAVKMLEATGSGVNETELSDIKNNAPQFLKDFNMRRCINRNSGLLFITEEGMERTRRWEEGRVTLDLENQTVAFEVLDLYSRETYEQEIEEYTGIEYEELEEDSFNPNNLNFDNFYKLNEVIERYPDGYKFPSGTVVSWMV